MSSKEDFLEVEGVIEESLPGATFRIILEGGQLILGHLSGKMRLNFIKILPGDRVLVEISVYDLSKGRITRRLPVIKQTNIKPPTAPVIPESAPDAQNDPSDVQTDLNANEAINE